MSYYSSGQAAKDEADRAAANMRLSNARANLLCEVTGYLEGLHFSSDRMWRAFVEFRAAENLHRKHAGLPLLPLPERDGSLTAAPCTCKDGDCPYCPNRLTSSR